MTKDEFCKKWQRGWKKIYYDGTQAYFFTEDQMREDLDSVIAFAQMEGKEFASSEVEKTLDLDEWHRKEAESIESRKTS